MIALAVTGVCTAVMVTPRADERADADMEESLLAPAEAADTLVDVIVAVTSMLDAATDSEMAETFTPRVDARAVR